MGQRRFQLHLSTAMILMIAAAGIIWENVRERDVKWYRYPTFLEDRKLGKKGWPLAIVSADYVDFNTLGGPTYAIRDGRSIIVPSIVVNALIALTLLLAIWFLCELPIWWREH